MRCSSSCRKRIKLKDAILAELAAASSPSMALSTDLIDLRLQQFSPTFQTPIHPPYSWMIQEAILKLNEGCGSSEEEISRFLEKEYEGLPWGHASFLSHHLKKLCSNGEIVCVNNVRYMLHVDDGDSGNEDKEMSHQLNISNSDEKEDRTLVRGKGREVEAIDGWSGVNSDQAVESENRCEVERHSVEVNCQNKACEQRIKEFEERKEGRRESIKEGQEESQNFSGHTELAKEVDIAKRKLAEVAQVQRGVKRKQPETTKQQIKVLKDDIHQPMMEEEKKYVEERQQQIKGGSGVMKSIGEQGQPRRGKMISEQCHPQEPKIDIGPKMLVFPCDGEDVKNLKTSLRELSIHRLEEEKKDALEHEGQPQRKLHHRERDFVVCDMPAQLPSESRANINQKAHKLHTDSISASFKSRELGQILLRQLKLRSPKRPEDLKLTTSERFTQRPAKFYTRREIKNSHPKVKTSFGMLKNLELEEKQEQQFRKPEKLLEYEIKTKQANFGGEEAAVSLSIEVKDSMDVPLDLGQHGREHKMKRIKVYVRRNVSKSRLKESENSNILPTNSE